MSKSIYVFIVLLGIFTESSTVLADPINRTDLTSDEFGDEEIGSHRHLEKRVFIFPVAQHPIPENSTFRWLMDRLVDYGYYTVGINRQCRELAVCQAGNALINRMPEYIVQKGIEKVKNLPMETLGSHEFTEAWVLGLASANETGFCEMLYDCDKTAKDPEDEQIVAQLTSGPWVPPNGTTVN